MYLLVANLAKLILHILGKIEVKHKNKIPAEGGYIVTCTHKGWLDVIVLGISLPRPIHFMAKQELFRNKLIGRFLSSINAFPVNREKPSPSSIKKPVKLLKAGEVVGIFPGGTRSVEDASLKRGAVTIASLARVPIVPAAYEGPRDLKGFLKSRKATLVFGEPFHVITKSKEELIAFTERLSEETNRLYNQIGNDGDKNEK